MKLLIFMGFCLLALILSPIFILASRISRDEDIKAFERDAVKGAHRVN